MGYSIRGTLQSQAKAFVDFQHESRVRFPWQFNSLAFNIESNILNHELTFLLAMADVENPGSVRSRDMV